MHTYEMIGVADENGRTYVSEFGSYNKDKGFDLFKSCKCLPTEDLLNILLQPKGEKPTPLGVGWIARF